MSCSGAEYDRNMPPRVDFNAFHAEICLQESILSYVMHLSKYNWNMCPGVDFKLFHESELNMAEIRLQESTLSYIMHLNWIWLKYASRSRFEAISCIWAEYGWNMPPGVDFKLCHASELNIAEICFQESILSYFMHLSWIWLKDASRSRS